MQNMQTLRCCRFGPLPGPPLGPDPCSRAGGRLTDMNRSYLKGNFVRVDVARRVVGGWNAAVFGGADPAARGAVGRCAGAAVQELHVVGDDLRGPPLLAVLPLPRAGLDAPFDEDERAFA